MAESARSGFDPGDGIGVVRSDIGASLPPRKRLLAGLKKQNGWLSSSSSSSSAASTVVNSPTLGLESCNLKSSLSSEEIVETSKAAALAAAKAAVAAKTIAIEKAAVAVKAAAAAKSALELAASAAREEVEARGFCSKSKPTKHVPIKLLYTGKRTETEEPATVSFPVALRHKSAPAKNEPIKLSYKGKRIETKGVKENPSAVPISINDEELARELHRAINSSPRISRSMRNLDGGHLEKRMGSERCRTSSHPPVIPKKCDLLRFASSGEIKSSDSEHVSKELGVCTYSRAVTSNANDWPLESEVGNLDKLAETVSVVMEKDNFRLEEHKLESSTMEEEASCSLQPNDSATIRHNSDTRDAISENKGGPKRKKLFLDTHEVEESQTRLSKCSRTQAQAGNNQDDRFVQETKGSPLTDESTLRSHARRSNMRYNSERRTKSISGDFPQESDISVEATSTWHRDTFKRVQDFAHSVNFSSHQSSHSVPLQAHNFASRSTRRRT